MKFRPRGRCEKLVIKRSADLSEAIFYFWGIILVEAPSGRGRTEAFLKAAGGGCYLNRTYAQVEVADYALKMRISSAKAARSLVRAPSSFIIFATLSPPSSGGFPLRQHPRTAIGASPSVYSTGRYALNPALLLLFLCSCSFQTSITCTTWVFWFLSSVFRLFARRKALSKRRQTTFVIPLGALHNIGLVWLLRPDVLWSPI